MKPAPASDDPVVPDDVAYNGRLKPSCYLDIEIAR
jgi:hypothetical protein